MQAFDGTGRTTQEAFASTGQQDHRLVVTLNQPAGGNADHAARPGGIGEYQDGPGEQVRIEAELGLGGLIHLTGEEPPLGIRDFL